MRYIVGGMQATQRIYAGEPYAEEWFDLKLRADTGAVLSGSDGVSNSERVSHMIVALIVDWSLVDEQGVKAPITHETFQSLPPEMTLPLLDVVQQPAFLASLQRGKSAATNQP